MKIKCVHCSAEFDVADYIGKGQDVLCPHCVRHFKYGEQKEMISEVDLQAAIKVCCKDKKLNEYYMKAPCGARLHIALIFYGKVYKDTLDQDAYLSLLEHVSRNELKERDLLYLFQYEEEGELKKYWLDRLVSEYGYDAVLDRTQGRDAIAKEIRQRQFSRNVLPGQPRMFGGRTVETSPRLNTAQSLSAGRPVKSSLLFWAACAAVLVVGLFGFLAAQFLMPFGGRSALHGSEDRSFTAISDDAETSVKPAETPDPHEGEKQRREKLSASCRKVLEEVDEMRSVCVQARNILREDAERFQHELNELSSVNNFREGKATAEGRQRPGNAEYAMMIAKSASVNELYARYVDGNLKSSGDHFKSEILSLLNHSGVKMNDRICAIEKKAEEFVQAIIKSVNDGINGRESEIWEAEKHVRKVISTAKQSEAMLRLGSLSETERLLDTIEQDKWQNVMAKLKSLPMATVAMAYGDIGSDEFTFCDDSCQIDKSETDVRQDEITDRDNQEYSSFMSDVKQNKKGPAEYADIPASTEPKQTNRRPVRESSVEKPPVTRRRAKCKSPERCHEFAERGQNFCEMHRCQSYGCKEHRATLTIPAWFDVGKRDRVTGSSIKRDFRKLKIPYCKRHMCQRTVIQPSDRKSQIRHYWNDYYGDQFGAEFFFCTNERLAKGKYCSEHVCKVPTCSAPRWEYWIEPSAEKIDEHEFRGRLPTSLTEFRGLRLKRTETCKGHSATDPDAIRDRTDDELQTEGDQRKAREAGD